MLYQLIKRKKKSQNNKKEYTQEMMLKFFLRAKIYKEKIKKKGLGKVFSLIK